ncbi:MAG: hypothetical protein FWF96_01645 [Kiritimatiellaeota bacterium]|nr:hypothetical protein [Kiritimatiellota bacterium]
MKKKNIIWRAACILMALTLATTSVTLTRAKYVSNDVASGTNFQVYRLLPAIVHTSFHRTTFNANLTTYYNCPAGKWAFFIIGGYGLGNGGSSGNSEANTSSLEGRRKPGILCGIYTKASTGTFTIGNIPYGARNGGSGGNGGCGKYILDTITSRPDNVATNDTTKKASLANIVTVAGGGGGRSGSNNGGYAGGYQGVNGPPTATVQNINSPYGQPETGIIDGWRGEDAAAQTTSRGSGNPGDAMAGGGSGSRWEWWKGGDGGNGGGGSDGSNGGWFQGGLGGSRSGYNCAGGGGGVFGEGAAERG